VRGTVGGCDLVFCCFGCLLAMQVTRARGEEGGAAAILVRLGLAIFFAMNVMMTSMPSYVPQVYGGAPEPLDGPMFRWLRWLAAAFSVPVLALLGGPLFASAWRALRDRRASADILVATGVIAAYGLSAWNLVAGRPEVYFETAAMLLLLVTFGRFLEARARAEAGASVRAALSPVPSHATRLLGSGREEVETAALCPGDVVEVAAGAVLPADGVVVEGEAGVDESMLTGESRLVRKEPGSEVAGGTCSVDGRLRVRVTAPVSESAAARIEALLAGARRERSRAERLADAVAGVLTPMLFAVAVAAGVAWGLRDGVDRGVLVAISVLVVACPCGLGIATPVAVWVALQAAARRGVVVRSAPVLERLASVGRVLFDKTGTLTDAHPQVRAVAVAPGGQRTPAEILATCAALESGIEHPLARAIARAHSAVAAGDAPPAEEVRAVAGAGVEGRVGGRRVAVGSARLAAERLGRETPGWEPCDWSPVGGAAPGDGEPTTVAFVVEDGRLLGAIGFAERPRDGAASALGEVRALGLGVSVVSGDASARAIVPALVSRDEVEVGLAPADKLDRIRRLRRAGGSGAGAIAMVGDGINDAPALAAADVGIAVAGATDLARLTADVAILGGDLAAVPWLVRHARRVRRVAAQNLAWAFGYNLVAVGLAAAGWLSPLVASLAMIASSAAVVANARRLGERPPGPAAVEEISAPPRAA
jgi:heavy metal translocating P-type ATPase